MEIEFDPGLVEEVVFNEIKMREEKGDVSVSDEYHSLTDPIYENFPPDERPQRFQKIDWRFFEKLGFSAVIRESLDEFPEFEDKVLGAVVAKARNLHDEGSDLVKGPNTGKDQATKKRILLRLLPDRFREIEYLRRLLRHELMHVSDMLNDSFEYSSDRIGGNPMEENIIKERYAVFWDIFVDSRLIRRGKDTVSDREGRYREFESLYKSFPEEIKMAVFTALWEDESLTHCRLLELARDVKKVLAISGGLHTNEDEKHRKAFYPGAQCPLCGFRTFHWAEEIDQLPELVAVIKKDFPGWSPEEGACERCVEAYKVRMPLV